MKAGWIFALAGMLLPCACKKRSFERINSAYADSSSRDTPASGTAKLVKTTDINFKVKDVQQATEDLSTLVHRFKGMVMHCQTASEIAEKTEIPISSDSIIRITSVNITGNMTMKIPSVCLDSFIIRTTHLALYVNNQNIDVNDKTLDYLASSMKLKDRANFLNQQKKGKVIIKNPGDVLLVDDDKTDEEINNRRINELVRYSTVSLEFNQNNKINKEVIANDNVNSYNPPFFTRLTLALKTGCDIFVDLVIGLADIWVLVLAAVAAWFVYRRIKSKRTIVIKA